VLERRLLEFINGSLLPGKAPVDADARLFEDGYIDSIRVLDLIAFVEREIGRKVPDKLVRLSTFRSVRAIVATVENGFQDTQLDGERLIEYRGRRDQLASPIEALIARKELSVIGDGRVELAGTALALFGFFDAKVRAWGEELGATHRDLPSRISLATLERAEFTTAFPQLLVKADHEHALTPAACYHCYPERAGQTLSAEVITSVRAKCHRNETPAVPLERQREFTMREIVFFGTRRGVERIRQQLVQRVGRFVGALSLDGFVEAASDPFFTTASQGKRLVQSAGALKLELHLTLEGDRSVAVASFNHHHDHFGSRFGITLADGKPAHSGCVAFGIERWVLAFLTQHGLDESKWPEEVRSSLSARGVGVGSA
jgi:acyl carrier protein